MATVLKKALCVDGLDLSDLEQISELHDSERQQGLKRHYFLGGLLHINGLQIDSSLGFMLRDMTRSTEADMTSVTNYIVTINSENNGEERMIGETADQMHNLKNEPLTQQGKEAAQLIMGGDELLDSWQALSADDCLSQMHSHFSKIVLTGYSYGTSLIQQMQRDIVERLNAKGLPLEPLRAVSAVNIGAVDMPSCNGGLKADFNYVSNNSKAQNPGFTQVFTVKSTDKIMDSVIGRSLVPAKKSNQQVQVYGNDHLTFIVDYTSDSFIKRIGITRFAEGREVPRLNMNYDSEAHDLRLYLNTKGVIYSKSGIYLTYPASPLSSIIREFVGEAVTSTNGISVSDFQKADYIDAVTAKYNGLSQEFAKVVDDYEQYGYSEALVEIRKSLQSDLISKNPAP